MQSFMKKFSVYLLLILLITGGWQLLRAHFTDEEYAVRATIREKVEETFDSRASEFKSRYGLQRYSFKSENIANIILIHGLDEPGMVWRNLAPELAGKAYNVWYFLYPNDQPIGDSARLLYESLSDLHRQQISEVTLVGHSMGGLVTRELLTSPDLSCRFDQCQSPELPKIPLAVLVGTPNNGSELSRLRGLAELREQTIHLVNGELSFLRWIFDGAGEAGIDLLPGSRFLTLLNARPHPVHTEYLVIAGIIGNEERNELLQRVAAYPKLTAFTEGFDSFLRQVGDGMVNFESAKIEGLPFVTVDGNHTTIIRNLTETSARVPPAIPVILARLQKLYD
jgi:pimeloyl-ACP methyl ester carboxylesterase